MSSILKALQRLQGDRGTGGSPAPKPALQDQLARDLAAPPLVPLAQAPPEAEPPPSRARLAFLAVPIAAALAGVALAGWWLASGSSDDAEAPIVAAAGAPPAVAAEPAPIPTTTRRPAPMAPPPAARAPAPAPTPARASAAPPPAEAAALATDPDPDPNRRPRVAPLRRPTKEGEPPRFQVVAQAEKEAEPEAEAAEPAPQPRSEDPNQRPGAIPAKKPARGEETGTVRPADQPKRDAKPAAAPKPAKTSAPAAKKAAAKAPAASDGVVVLRTVWHPKPERRVARLQLPGMEEPIEVHEGDSVKSYFVKAIEPSGVVLEHGGRELRRGVGSGASED